MGNTTDSYKNISYFKGLNTLRFFAAYLVLMHHSESMKLKNGLESFRFLSLFQNGGNAVTFFFVLSGFLITYFLLKEKTRTQTVNVKKFYTKRLLRIWPLYFLLVFLGTVIVPFFINYLHIDYDVPYTLGQVWYLYALFLPGLVTFFYGHHLLEPLWSIGVEVMFYLMWAPLLKFVKKNVLYLLLGVIAVKIILLLLPYWFDTHLIYNYMVNMLSFEAMAIGGLGAYFVFNSKRDIASLFCYKRSIQVVVYVFLLIFLLFNINIENAIWRAVFGTPIISTLLVDFIFLYVILGVSLACNSLINAENKVFSYLGEISYGIYMYHTTVISVVILLLRKLSIVLNSTLSNCIFYLMVTIGTLLVAHLSKKYFEDYFLNFNKNKKCS